MSEDKAVPTKKELRNQQKEIRAEKTEITKKIRQFKKDHGSDQPKKIKDEAKAAELTKMIDALNEKEEKIQAIKKEMESATSNREKYGYPQIEDNDTKEMRDLNKTEKKRWRAHARGVAEKDAAINDPSEVPFDAEFFKPKAKKEKPAKKEEKEADKDSKSKDAPKEEKAAAGATEPAKKKKRRAED